MASEHDDSFDRLEYERDRAAWNLPLPLRTAMSELARRDTLDVPPEPEDEQGDEDPPLLETAA